ncbi:tyrosine-type recombinase/integrase [Mesorhizobium sp. M0491]|uniref:tyrosine-type recombinase/integrase n=1 Tax=Mesorhizobium sp. M0491 TaxID=2956950 RepID=UPI00333D250B
MMTTQSEFKSKAGDSHPGAHRGSNNRTVFFIDARAVAEGFPKKLIGVPFIVNEESGFELEISEYLWARRNADWLGSGMPGGIVAEASGIKKKRASLNFLRNRAYQLDAFRRWCRRSGVSHVSATEPLLEEYADEVEEVAGVRPQAVNQYLTSILDFLFFCSWRGWRDVVRLDRKPTASGAGAPLLLRVEDVREIATWYPEKDIRDFISHFELGSAMLAAEILYELGLRISEMLALTIHSFPSPAAWLSDRARRFLKVDGKGGKRRNVPLTYAICERVARHIMSGRRLYAGGAAELTESLILGPKKGGEYGPMTARYLQEQFAIARVASGKSGISPHILRHHYAAHYLLRAWTERSRARHSRADLIDVEPVSLLSADLLILKDSLGHAWIETTQGYLKAVTALVGADLQEEYAAKLESVR